MPRHRTAVTLALLVAVSFTGCAPLASGQRNTIDGDANACAVFSAAIEKIGAEVTDPANLSEGQADSFSELSRAANMAGRAGAFEGSGGGAESADLVAASRALAAADSVGAAAVNDSVTDKDRTASAAADVAAKVPAVVAACEAAGYPMTATTLTFPDPSSSQPAELVADPGQLIPDGFEDTGMGVAYRFVDDPQCDVLTCVQVELVAYDDCPTSVYVQGNTVDDAGTVYGLTNDLLGPIRSGERAIATLTITESAATGVELNEFSCL
ncbi:hypothetical protein [Agromyces humi]|uniref:hypothetical protein n=1 Tax=Agromyces humi TaxID=1766800 RepID=UPI00135C166D|nr:hypothetical protein [Agromyces humi]